MRELFNDILSIEGVKGVMFLSFSGNLIFKELTCALPEDPANLNWNRFLEALEGMRETDLVFEKGRLYIRRTDSGYLVIWMGRFVSIAMMRLNCDILLPALSTTTSSKKWGRFFRK